MYKKVQLGLFHINRASRLPCSGAWLPNYNLTSHSLCALERTITLSLFLFVSWGW